MRGEVVAAACEGGPAGQHRPRAGEDRRHQSAADCRSTKHQDAWKTGTREPLRSDSLAFETNRRTSAKSSNLLRTPRTLHSFRNPDKSVPGEDSANPSEFVSIFELKQPISHSTQGVERLSHSYVMDRKRSRTGLRRSTCVTVCQPATAWTSRPSRSVAPDFHPRDLWLVRTQVVSTGSRRVT